MEKSKNFLKRCKLKKIIVLFIGLATQHHQILYKSQKLFVYRCEYVLIIWFSILTITNILSVQQNVVNSPQL